MKNHPYFCFHPLTRSLYMLMRAEQHPALPCWQLTDCFHPTGAQYVFCTNGLLTFRDQWSQRTTWLLLLLFLSVGVIWVIPYRVTITLSGCPEGLPSKHPIYTLTCPLPRPTDPHINFFSLHWKFENTFSTELKWMTCCHVRFCSAVLNYPHITPRHTTFISDCGRRQCDFSYLSTSGTCFFWLISNQICDVNIWTFFTLVETFLLQTLKQVQKSPTEGQCFNTQHHSGDFSGEQPKCTSIPQKMYHPGKPRLQEVKFIQVSLSI